MRTVMRIRVLAIVGSLLLTTQISGTTLPAQLSSLGHSSATSTAKAAWWSLGADRTFPDDTGMLNVKTVYGAVGDGVADDTAAIQKAISTNVRKQDTSRIIYFPPGTYRVTKPLVWKDLANKFQSELTFQGSNQGTTIIKLSDSNPSFQNTTAPNPVVDTTSLEPSGPDAGAGGGNNGFDNYLFDITVDTGKGNPGAIAVNFISNNYCGLRNVTLRSGDKDHIGVAGLGMSRYATGPCLMKNVTIDGFNYAVAAARQEYSITFENLAIKNQLIAGIINTDNVLTIRNLVSTNTVPAIQNFGTPPSGLTGLVTLIGAQLLGGSHSVSAIQNYQTLYARNVVTTGYRSAISNAAMSPIPGSSVTEYTSGPTYTQFGGTAASLKLPIQETPDFEEADLTKWVSVVSK